MSAPESHPDIESTLADAFAQRHARQRPGRPSLIDVHRRAHRQSSRRAAGTAVGVATTALSVEDLWQAVAAQLGTTVDDLRVLNPMLDFGAAPVPDTPIVVRNDDEGSPNITAPWPTVVTTAAGAGDTTAPPTTVWIDTTVTVLGGAAVPHDPLGWTNYRIVAGDYLAGIAEQFCTTTDELVAGNGWESGLNTPLFPGDLIAVPADAC